MTPEEEVETALVPAFHLAAGITWPAPGEFKAACGVIATAKQDLMLSYCPICWAWCQNNK